MASTGLLLLVSAELYKNLENHPDASFTTNVVIYNKIEPLSDISPLELLIGDSVCTSTLYVWKNQDKLLKATIGDLINITYLDITEQPMTPAHQLLSSEAHHQQTKWKVTMDGKNSHVYQESDKKDILTCFRCITVMPFCTRVSIIGQVQQVLLPTHKEEVQVLLKVKDAEGHKGKIRFHPQLSSMVLANYPSMRSVHTATVNPYVLLCNVVIKTSITSKGDISLWISKNNNASQIQVYCKADDKYQDVVFWYKDGHLLAQFQSAKGIYSAKHK